MPTAIGVLVALVSFGAAGCSGDSTEVRSPTENSSPGEPLGGDSLSALQYWPEDDRTWEAAVRFAGRNGKYGELRRISRDLGLERPERWEPLWTSAVASRAMGRSADSREEAQRALESGRRLGDSVAIARAGELLGRLHHQAGDFSASRSHYQVARVAARSARRDDLAAYAINGLLIVAVHSGDLKEAAALADEAILAFESAGLSSFARQVRANRASVLLELGDTRSALQVLERSYAGAVNDGDTQAAATMAQQIGNVKYVLREFDSALEWYERVPPSASKPAQVARIHMSRIAIRRGDLEQAQRLLQSVIEDSPDPLFTLHAEAHLAEVDTARGRFPHARARLQRTIIEADRIGADETRWLARWLDGRLWLAQNDYPRAVESLRHAVAIIDGQADDLDPLGQGLRFLRARTDPYVDLATALRFGRDVPPQHRGVEILRVLEKTHARTLRRVLGERAGAPLTLRLPELQHRLTGGDLILSYLIGEDRGILLALRRESVHVVEIAGWRELRPPLRRYREALRRPLHSADARLEPERDLNRSLTAGRQLATLLLEPIEPLLDGVNRIYLVPDRELALLPFAALPWLGKGEDPDSPVRFLGEVVETAVLPLEGPPPRRVETYAPMLLAGDPTPDRNGAFPELEQAEAELRSSRELWGDEANATFLTQDELTPERFLAEPLESFRMIHLATHAVASTADLDECAVYFSDGMSLDLETIADLPLEAAPLVVLSACRTGDGELIPGEGVVGLGWAFLRAGASAVLVSLWSVEDAAATKVIVGFHQGLRDGLDPVAALARSQREVARERFHPAFWAPFVLILPPESSS